MKQSVKKICLCFILIFYSSFSISCGRAQMEKEQEVIFNDFIHYFENVLTTVEAKGKDYVETLKKSYYSVQSCDDSDLKSEKSSIYLPKVAVHGPKLNCLMKAESVLDPEWEQFYNETGYISWQYIYDDGTKSLRLHPATNPLSLFGDNLTLESLHFFKGAVAHFPEGVWYGVGNDINGTGRIIIYSQALEFLPHNFTVLGIDIKTSQIIKTYQGKILDFALRFKSPHVFVYSFMKENNFYIDVHDFSTNLPQWSLLKGLRANLLNIPDREIKSLLGLEKIVKHQSPLSVSKTVVSLNDKKHICLMSRLKTMEIYSLMCSEL